MCFTTAGIASSSSFLTRQFGLLYRAYTHIRVFGIADYVIHGHNTVGMCKLAKKSFWNLEMFGEACAEAGGLLGYDGDFANDPQSYEGVVVVHELHHQVRNGGGHCVWADFGSHINAKLCKQLANIGHGVIYQLCSDGIQLQHKFVRSHHRQEGQHLKNRDRTNLNRNSEHCKNRIHQTKHNRNI